MPICDFCFHAFSLPCLHTFGMPSLHLFTILMFFISCNIERLGGLHCCVTSTSGAVLFLLLLVKECVVIFINDLYTPLVQRKPDKNVV